MGELVENKLFDEPSDSDKAETYFDGEEE